VSKPPEPPRPTQPLSFTVSGIIGTLVVLLVAVVCVRLGIWQLDRLEQRRERNMQMQARLAEPPLLLDAAPSDTAGHGFRRVHVSGELDNERSIALAGRSFRGAPGVHLLTPLRLSDGSAVLVNRGWVPSPDGASIDVQQFSEEARIEAAGMVLPLPGATDTLRESPSANTDEFQRVWFRVHPQVLHRQFPYPLADFQVQLLPTPTSAGLPRRLPPPELDEGPHLGYAIQWFSFATIAVIGWLALVLKRK
jgi:surfeit locus 1 family protein